MPRNEYSPYTERFNMVMLPEERAMLRALAASIGLNKSDVIRQIIRREYAERFGVEKPGEQKTKANSRVPHATRAEPFFQSSEKRHG